MIQTRTYARLLITAALSPVLCLAACGEDKDHELVKSIAKGGKGDDQPGNGTAPAKTPKDGQNSDAEDMPSQSVTADGLAFDIPFAWTQQPTTSPFQRARFSVGENGTLTISGGIRGEVATNLARWERQFTGGPTAQQQTVTSDTGLTIHAIEASGTYDSGLPSSPGPAPNTTLLGAIVEGGPDGLVFIKLIAPTAEAGQKVHTDFAQMLVDIRRAR